MNTETNRPLAARSDVDLRVELELYGHEAARLTNPTQRAAAASMLAKVQAEQAHRAAARKSIRVVQFTATIIDGAGTSENAPTTYERALEQLHRAEDRVAGIRGGRAMLYGSNRKGQRVLLAEYRATPCDCAQRPHGDCGSGPTTEPAPVLAPVRSKKNDTESLTVGQPSSRFIERLTNMEIRILVESESPENARTFDARERRADGDYRGLTSEFVALMPRRAGLTVEEARAEVVRLRGLGHIVTGDRAAKTLGVVS